MGRGASATLHEHILDVASDLFYRRGIRAVGVDAIVARSGIAKMTLYQHFRSKEELILAFLRRRDERWRSWLRGAVEGRVAAPAQRLLAIFDALGEWFASPDFRGCAFINTAIEIADPGHPAHRAALEHKRQLQAFMADLAREAGAREEDADALSRRLMLLVEGAIVTALVGTDRAAAQEARKAAAVLIDTLLGRRAGAREGVAAMNRLARGAKSRKNRGRESVR